MKNINTGWCLMNKMFWTCKNERNFAKFLPIIFAKMCSAKFRYIFCEIPRNFAKLLWRNFTKFREINFNFVFREIKKSTFVSTLSRSQSKCIRIRTSTFYCTVTILYNEQLKDKILNAILFIKTCLQKLC
jgi:hypothetical protein